MGYSNRALSAKIARNFAALSSLDRFLAVNSSVYRVKSTKFSATSATVARGTEAIIERKRCIAGSQERAKCFSQSGLPRSLSLLHRCKNSFSRFSIPIIEPAATAQETVPLESFLNYPVKTKGKRCGYRHPSLSS